ncbi:hypothetical protein L553_0400 [Bordetella pertussis I036]|nr:hypothetical protein L547_0184 [Bordetella pertussis H918]ETH49435.1 hypothetical protein L548_4098 [Bordetella pertussis H921]ETH57860.1 hypothetical protein L553_0400 [Bordetella pertussis I036]ETH74536.1 hypothetical protein L555_3767 [Bordetella pertussis STO1-CHOC-0008]ETH81077.1 hypothetical protein L559_4101 [Bordetella pertussis STO1-CHOC-0017]ETH87125.1 hypothetical protein L560_4082 [Bordetella pertussis STO1-CHOC-0018]ETH92831.1 hypothetical protein L561_4227 [Bordetella pertuss
MSDPCASYNGRAVARYVDYRMNPAGVREGRRILALAARRPAIAVPLS